MRYLPNQMTVVVCYIVIKFALLPEQRHSLNSSRSRIEIFFSAQYLQPVFLASDRKDAKFTLKIFSC